MPAAAFFDLDGTLLAVNSARLWLARERRLGHVSRWQMARAMACIGGYHLGVLDMDATLRAALATIRGTEEASIRAQTRAWWADEVRPRVAPGGRAVVEAHRRAGEKAVLLTSSSRYAAEMAKEEFGLDDVLFQGYETRDGLFTGVPCLPICYGRGKVEAAETWAAANGVDLDASAFYTDSYTDLPMLERVGRPFVVQPDPRLRRAARSRGWPVLDWSTLSSLRPVESETTK
jgi:HAD superfamily hydrolase (TIGR01490 family)